MPEATSAGALPPAGADKPPGRGGRSRWWPPAGGSRIAFLSGVVLVVGAVGPRLRVQDRPAHAPFSIDPPLGYAPAVAPEPEAATPDDASADADDDFARDGTAWVRSDGARLAFSTTTTRYDGPAAAAEIAAGMPDVFAAEAIDWTRVDARAIARPDGATVSAIGGTAKRAGEAEPFCTLQYVFPTDDGSAIVTATHACAHDREVRAALDAAARDARGVAFRSPPPTTRERALWMAGAAASVAIVLAAASRRAA